MVTLVHPSHGQPSDTSYSEHTSTSFVNNASLLSDEEKSLAKQWMLQESDWVKYKTIMQGPRGIWSPSIDPITALGVSEDDPKERKRYAEILMRMEIARVEREIAFEVVRFNVGQKLTQGQLAVNNQAWIDEWEKDQVQVRKQVLLFVNVDCTEDCVKFVENVKQSVGDNSRLDVYFGGNASAESIGQWAAFMNIDPKKVKAKKVTLNFDEGLGQSMGVQPGQAPQVRVVDLKTGDVRTTFQ